MQHTSSKVAFITGSARRIGAETACLLHEQGINIVLHYHYSQSEAMQLCHTLNKRREHSAMVLRADLSKIHELDGLVDESLNAFGRLDVLVNNASRFYKTPIGKVTEENWNDLMDSNLKSQFFLSQKMAPYLKIQRGCIVNIIDIHAEKPVRDYSVYCITKAGLMMLTKSLAKELGPEIRVNGVSPGAIAWPEGGSALSDDIKDNIIQSTALKRCGDPDDIAKAVIFFVQNAEYVTGQVLCVDSGRML